MTVYIQKLPVPGLGDKLFPDAAMSAGTRALIDTADAWSWGGTTPGNGDPISVGEGPSNYALAEDGWTEDQAAANDALTYENGAVSFSAAVDRMSMPAGFKPKVTDLHLGYVFWLKNIPFASGSGFNNTLLSCVEETIRLQLVVVYTSTPGDVSAIEVKCQGVSNWALGASNPFTAALFDGAVHQFALEFERDGSGFMRQKAFLDGVLVADRGLVTDSALAWGDSGSDTVKFGRQSGYSGSGLNGGLYRAFCDQLDFAGVRSFVETVALDYQQNAQRLAAL